MQIAPDNKIYFAISWTHAPIDRNLGVINQPDSAGIGCNFKPFSFYLGDSSKTNYGLPNMPNYELGPLSIYQANAGEDQVLCEEDSTVKGVFIGAPAIPGVSYSWSPSDSLDNPSKARPFAYPSQTTTYIVTFTDTSIKNSCQSRTDTVVLEVRNCSVGIEEAASYKPLAVSIYPNPTNRVMSVECRVMGGCESYELRLYDVLGRNVLISQLAEERMDISVEHLESGIYFYTVSSPAGLSQTGKLMVSK